MAPAGETARGNLVSLKCLLFCFFGGIGCLFPFLPLHMRKVGLSVEEAHIVSITAPLVAVLGPLVAGPLADNFGSWSSRNNGGALRVMLAVSIVMSAVGYSLLLAIPTVEHLEARRPAVSFRCDANGAEVSQEQCVEHSSCYQWPEAKMGALILSDCLYDCLPEAYGQRHDGIETTVFPLSPGSTENGSEDDGGINDYDIGNLPMEVDMNEDEERRRKRHAISLTEDADPPHVCVKMSGRVLCHVYSDSSRTIAINATLLPSTNPEASYKEWCQYPLGRNVWCPIPPALLAPMGHEACHVVCSLEEPYTTPGSVLAESQCQQELGDPAVTFWTYLLVRSVAEIFPSAVVTLLNTAIVIATCDTSSGHADVGRQLVFATLGFAFFAPVIEFITYLNFLGIPKSPTYNLLQFAVFAALMIVSALIVVCARTMHLGPPEWWWSSRKSLAGAGRSWRVELITLIVVLVLLGAFFGAIDSYLPWYLSHLRATSFYIGLTLTVGALPAIPFLWHSEKVIDYCGHSNLLVTAFTFYIIRYTGLSYGNLSVSVLCELLEVFTLSLMWVTAILYIRHLVPRHLTATGQGAAVIAHFCIGRSLGAVFAGTVSDWSDSMTSVYRYGAVMAGVAATVYFVLYHCCLNPARCSTQGNPPSRTQAAVVQGAAPTNGSYTPLGAYDERNGNSQHPFRY